MDCANRRDDHSQGASLRSRVSWGWGAPNSLLAHQFWQSELEFVPPPSPVQSRICRRALKGHLEPNLSNLQLHVPRPTSLSRCAFSRRAKDFVSWLRSSAARALSVSDWDTSAPFVRQIYPPFRSPHHPHTLGFRPHQMCSIIAEGVQSWCCLGRTRVSPSEGPQLNLSIALVDNPQL